MVNQEINKPKVLFLNHSSEMGGAEYSLLDIIKNYRDCKVILFSKGKFNQILKKEKAQVEYLPLLKTAFRVKRQKDNFFLTLRSLPEVFSAAYTIAKIAKNYDVIYANSQKAFIVGALAAFLSKKPLIWHLRDILSKEHFTSFKIWVDVIFANLFAKRIIANSQATAKAFIASGGKHSITVIYNDFLQNDFPIISRKEKLDYQKLLKLKNRFTIGIIGRLAPWKGQHIAINALKHLPDTQLLVVGGPLFGNDEYLQELKKMTRKLNLKDRVFFLSERNDVLKIIQICDTIIHTSIAPEPFGRVIVESLFCKIPVIATNTGGAKEILKNGAWGQLVPPDNPKLLAKAVEKVQKNSSAFNNKSKKVYSQAIIKFGFKNTLLKIFNLIVRTVHEKK